MAETFICLLRAVNVGGRKLVMADLRAAAEAAGFEAFRTYIQSGNLLFSAKGNEAEAEDAIEALIETAFGLKVIALVRSARHFAEIAEANPFPEALPNQLHLCLTKHPPYSDASATLAARALAGERIALAGGALWIDFARGVGNSKLTPPLLDKAAGSTLTARNWNTVQKLIEMVGE
ncbi:DUF1697 domain-containing protein [Sphingomonas sp. BIUV-7]|uniref:DUF1697 domain-containing protein n=1 Tax=Sphingomonas natans TaxID=3063330 RepID=A0ABT8YEW2_9SPHN|nr:DUF1697 domain-containing protein [Sphingomonas sp. BIUV-7]MDO6416902.1 DUF1697 domain-containing protein [Sphingomonas sp. BIUV-7]